MVITCLFLFISLIHFCDNVSKESDIFKKQKEFSKIKFSHELELEKLRAKKGESFESKITYELYDPEFKINQEYDFYKDIKSFLAFIVKLIIIIIIDICILIYNNKF